MASRTKTTTPSHIDYGLLILIFALIGFGIVMQFSASYAIDAENPYRFITKHLMWIGLGLVGMYIMAAIDYHTWENLAIPIMFLSLGLLMAVIFLGEEGVAGARRHLFGGSIQPSEVAKLAIIIYIAAWLASKGDKIGQVTMGLLPFSLIVGVFLVLILSQPDVSTSVLLAIIALSMLIVAGADILQIGILILVMSGVFAFAISRFSYAQSRVDVFFQAFLRPWESPQFQVKTGYAALHSGGLFGKGLTNSEYKLGILPLVHSDLVFAVIGEELGLLGALAVIAMFLFLGYKGTRIALHAQDDFGRLLAFGITTWIVVQAFINIAVVTVTIPNTGMPLPFFSYGGTSTLMILTALGILLNISKGGGGRFRLDAHSLFRRRNRRSRVSHSHRRGRA
ncbi:MAG TPA: cell division protein FtsW [Anaerolineae bacterium]|nr:cell division protein FtsW [Anaerolineae bacterium]